MERPNVCPPYLTNQRAESLWRSGRAAEACELLTTALPQIERGGNGAAFRQAINLLGAANFDLGELSQASAHFQRALELARRDKDDRVEAQATNNLGAIANVRGDRERALSMYAIAIAAYQRLGQTRGLAHAHHNMAITFRHMALFEQSDEHERRAIEYATEADNPRLIALARLGRAEVSLLRGDAALAQVAAARVADEFAALSDPVQQADALRVLGRACASLGQRSRALGVLDQALALARQHGSALTEAEVLSARADVRLTQGSRTSARADAHSAMRIFERLDAVVDRERMARWLRELDTIPGERRGVTRRDTR